ncbi:hypothetical protein JCM16303_002472 [Sporobolomyces ruberrimus]
MNAGLKTRVEGGGTSGATTSAGISGDLWSTILDSVKGTRGVGTKQCIVLGAPHSGKSTLVQRISTPTGELLANGSGGDRGAQPLDLGMSYSVLEVKDEGTGDEDTLARLSIYQLPSPSPPYPALLPLALSKKTLLDSLVVIVLDWERPWSFLRELRDWIAMLETILEKEVGKDAYELAEGKERIETCLRNYHEPPSTSNGTTASTSAATAVSTIDTDSPLPVGTLIENLGLPLVVVCTKADQINMLEREREFTEEQFDYVQQTLRTICLRYGASLFFTSQTLPNSYTKLRQYILHRLFSTPTSAAALPTTSNSTPAAPSQPTSARAFPFPHRANVIDRDQALVPTGWDSWGKIRILREKFDCEKVGEGWEEDLRSRTRGEGDEVVDDGASGLRKEYEMVIVDFDSEDRPTNTAAVVAPQDEQSFLQTHYAALQSDLEKDPRLAFRQQSSSSSGPSSSTARNGIVGPMAGNISDLPSVQGALERASGGSSRSGERESSGRERERERSSASGSSALGMSMSRQGSGSSNLPSRASLLSQASSTTTASPGGLPSSSTTGAAGAAGSAAGGNQVLADFFQSLLTARSGSGSGSATPAGGGLPRTVKSEMEDGKAVKTERQDVKPVDRET